MFDKLLTIAASNAKLAVAGAVGAALVAGGSAVTIAQVSHSGPATSASSTADKTGDDPAGALKDATATEPAEPVEAAESDSHTVGIDVGVHGACVKLAATAAPVAGTSHGSLVSAAAKTCPTGNAKADAARKAAADRKAAAAARKAAAQKHKPATTGRPTGAGSQAGTSDTAGKPTDAGSQGASHSGSHH